MELMQAIASGSYSRLQQQLPTDTLTVEQAEQWRDAFRFEGFVCRDVIEDEYGAKLLICTTTGEEIGTFTPLRWLEYWGDHTYIQRMLQELKRQRVSFEDFDTYYHQYRGLHYHKFAWESPISDN